MGRRERNKHTFLTDEYSDALARGQRVKLILNILFPQPKQLLSTLSLQHRSLHTRGEASILL